MSKQAASSVHYLPESPRAIHADIMAEIARTPEEPAEAAPNPPARAARSFDMSAPLARIEDAWRYIESCSERIQELETFFETLKKREVELKGQLKEVKRALAG